MKATTLRNILIVCVVLALAGIGVFMYYAGSYLRTEAAKTSRTKIDIEMIDQNVEQLKLIKQSLDANRASIDKARQIVSDSKQYQYQDQIINDINTYAAASGVQVVGYDFGSTTTPTDPTKLLNAPQINGVKALTATLSLGSPMEFDSYLRFVRAIEQNLTKMQVSGINISPDPKNSSQIINPSVVIIIYVR